MRGFLTRLWKDRRGNALVIAGAALPLVVGSAGLATDTIQWATWKRQLQRSADSAALAGAYARAQELAPDASVARDLQTNHCVDEHQCADALLSGYPKIGTPADAGNWTSQVKVDLAIQRKLGFSSFFMSEAPIITASATAAMIPDGEYCVVALNKTATPGITISGSASVSMGCGAIANSTSPTSAVDVNGNAYFFGADPVAAVGGMPSEINGATELQPYHVALPDPFANKYSTGIPSGMNCKNFNSQTYTESTGNGKNKTSTTHVSPGCFNSFNPGNGTFYLDPGVYYLDSTSISLNGQTTLIGTDVTIILTGNNPGSISMNGNSVMQLTAPTTGPYAKMLMIQAGNATTGNNNTINGNNLTKLDGAMYFPKGDLEFTGSSAQSTKCAMVVGYTVDFGGNTAIQNDTTGCTSDMTVSAKQIRLVA